MFYKRFAQWKLHKINVIIEILTLYKSYENEYSFKTKIYPGNKFPGIIIIISTQQQNQQTLFKFNNPDNIQKWSQLNTDVQWMYDVISNHKRQSFYYQTLPHSTISSLFQLLCHFTATWIENFHLVSSLMTCLSFGEKL